MMDWLPFLHPVWQCVGLVLGFVTLREGLALRHSRRHEGRNDARATRRRRHVRLGKSCLWIIGSGYLLGMSELFWVRGEPILRSAHFYFATLALALLFWGALYGFAMVRGPGHYAERRELHGFLLPLALIVLVGVGILGLTLLP
jgi:polyferredoxin